MKKRYFEYGEIEIQHLCKRDVKLARAIDATGHVYREMMDEGDLFKAIVHHVIGQQISAAALTTVWSRVEETLRVVTPESVLNATEEQLQSCGTTFKKVNYIKGFAEKVAKDEFNLDAIKHMSDAEAISALKSIPGIGEWTAEMLLLFCLGRPDILSYGDLAIHRGMRMVYHHQKITREMFERYRRRYSPYGSVASLYLWAVSHMDVPGYELDYTSKTTSKTNLS